MRVQPSRVRRLRARRAGRRAVAGAFALASVLAVRPSILTGLEASAVAVSPSPPVPAGLMTPVVLTAPSVAAGPAAGPAAAGAGGSALASGNRVAVPGIPPVRLELTVANAAVGWTVERPQGVGVWVAPRLGFGAHGALKLPAGAAPSVIPLGWLTLHRARPVTVVVKGKDHDVLTNAATVRQLLSAMGIEPDGNDRVAPSLQTPLPHATRVRFDSVEFRWIRHLSPIPFAVHTTLTRRLAPGRVRIVHTGVEGALQRVYRVRLVNGHEVSTELVSTQAVREPVDGLRRVGAQPPPPPPPPRKPAASHERVGDASWYDHPGLTAASPWLPFGTEVTVRNLENGKMVTVVINDRGPFGGRIIDLSREAFSRIAPLFKGVCRVRITW